MRKPIFYVLMILIATVVPLVLAEAALRLYFGTGVSESELRERLQRSEETAVADGEDEGTLFGLVRPSEHQDVIFELKPNLDATFRGAPLRTSSYGLRDRHYELEKPAGTFRIVGLGDSHMFGWRVREDQSYLDIVERRLNETAPGGRRFEVINCASPGYNTTMEVATFERRCAAFDPDLVVMHFVGNDFGLPRFLQPPRGASPARWYLVELVRSAFGVELDDEGGLVAHYRETPDEYWDEMEEPYRYMTGKPGYSRAMERLAALTGEISVIVVMLGDGSEARRFARAVAESHGFEVVNLAPRLSEHLAANGFENPSKKDWRRTFQFVGKDRHPNALSHRLYAETLLERIEARLDGGGVDPPLREE